MTAAFVIFSIGPKIMALGLRSQSNEAYIFHGPGWKKGPNARQRVMNFTTLRIHALSDIAGWGEEVHRTKRQTYLLAASPEW